MQPELLLYTRLAQSLYKGSWQHGKMGHLQFAHLMAECNITGADGSVSVTGLRQSV